MQYVRCCCRIKFYAYLFFCRCFLGLYHDDVDDVLAEDLDALGHYLSFRSWG